MCMGFPVVARGRNLTVAALVGRQRDHGDEALIDELVAEPSIANVYSGRYPTYYTAPGIPHDGFLAGFLMRCKGFARD